jgi:hypothetical protein
MIKAEIGGAISNLEIRIENTLAPLVDRIAALEHSNP